VPNIKKLKDKILCVTHESVLVVLKPNKIIRKRMDANVAAFT
jgi:hypothetical protein